ncbi:formin-like protein 5 [Brachypodium distachyon]|uniref:formin-like protein 5 n=1 Tax=Brachypodium distachyon TaxID=15368 RepID=UPI00071D906A|nr:formin-like protein 5 [Brachypodium distachyon]|eukprot:XP_014751821.1 formin-like protein 5 [Brachypodium distachyon]
MAPASPGSAPSPPAPPAPALPDSAPPASPEYMPSMEWLMAGPAPPMLGEEDDFVLALAPPPPSLFCPIHGHGPCPTRDGTAPPPPSPTPPATPPRIDFNSNQTGGGTSEADRNDDSGLEVINPKARPRLLRCFAAAMAAHRAGPGGGGWNPATLGTAARTTQRNFRVSAPPSAPAGKRRSSVACSATPPPPKKSRQDFEAAKQEPRVTVLDDNPAYSGFTFDSNSSNDASWIDA